MATRTSEVTKIHPITLREHDLVVAWIFTLTLREGDKHAMDTVTIGIDPPAARKPLAQWTKSEVHQLVATALGPMTVAADGTTVRTPPQRKVAELHRVLDTRLDIHEHTDFDVESLP